MKRVLLGMSGGVDSSVAVHLLQRAGYEVVGITLRLRKADPCDAACSCERDISDAKKVADIFGIEHITQDFQDLFRRKVVEYFANEYLAGRTPNPCIMCNRYLKFDAMFSKADELACDYIATGHYAHTRFDELTGLWQLRRATCSKDQSYALYSLGQRQLSRVLFPLSNIEKPALRQLATDLGLPVADKPDSQEICFIPGGDYNAFLREFTRITPPEGDFLDLDGNVIGRHRGITSYTVGQRKGLGSAFHVPMYVVQINPLNNTVILSPEGSQYSNSLIATELCFTSGVLPTENLPVHAKIRYLAPSEPSMLVPLPNGQYRVDFLCPQRAITPGQSVVFYRGDTVLGGGIIVK